MKRLPVIILVLSLIKIQVQAQIGLSTVGVSNTIGIDLVGMTVNLGESTTKLEVCPTSCNIVLPVTGIELQARRLNANEVQLNWATHTEVNNKGFFIQQSLANTFEFRDVSFVYGAGNSVQKIKYNVKDSNNFEGISYYRLRQSDYDDGITYSNIAEVKGIYQNKFSIYPNPAVGHFTVLLNQIPAGKKLTISISDATARIVYQQTRTNVTSASIGVNNIPVLQPGTYIVTIYDGTNNLSGKLTIAR